VTSDDGEIGICQGHVGIVLAALGSSRHNGPLKQVRGVGVTALLKEHPQTASDASACMISRILQSTRSNFLMSWN
jgi:hypothetical protein